MGCSWTGLANANPRSLISWANLIIEYAEWLDPCPAGWLNTCRDITVRTNVHIFFSTANDSKP